MKVKTVGEHTAGIWTWERKTERNWTGKSQIIGEDSLHRRAAISSGLSPHSAPAAALAMEFQSPSSDKLQPVKQYPPPASPSSSSSTSSSAANIRLWKPAAQRNLRNQWSKLASLRRDWVSSSSTARSHATSLVNSYLSQMYMSSMELGVLSDMPGIRKKASLKLFKQQELQRNNLLASYKDLVDIVTRMVYTSKSMRCYVKGMSNSPLSQFSISAEIQDDSGDGGGVSVFSFWPISQYELLAKELVEMFVSELNLKRLLLMELLSLGHENVSEISDLNWSDEFYPGEFDYLAICNLYSDKDSQPVLPSFGKCNAEIGSLQPQHKQDRDVLQVYLTTWIAEVNIERSRVDDILSLVGAEMCVTIT
ncbi:OLC1v1012197C1 [Oldenlandia corymbosa var. corymbosa]|uniref:OLC1v1012197C1 n=1 Tax=Oldenlandia corymbosa var. corymbosa TaxID=529605 RepID=A0AAV1DYY4_OLDCO|nr:OLC1v1012197C1 [Oldenlandia corymbosa var. corymbosa]